MSRTRDGLAGIGLLVVIPRLLRTARGLIGAAVVGLIVGKVWWDGLPGWKRALLLAVIVGLVVLRSGRHKRWLSQWRPVEVRRRAPQDPPGPRLGYVYRYWDRDGTLLYIGKTNDLGRRTGEHERDGRPWMRPGVTVTTEILPTPEAALDVEEVAIRHERPLYNVMMNGGRA